MKLKFILIFVLAVYVKITSLGQIRKFDRDKGLVFEYKDYLNNPMYEWPNTLIFYYVDFNSGINKDNLELINLKNSKVVPFQLSDVVISKGEIDKAKVNFITNVPSGGSFSYQLRVKESLGSKKTESFASIKKLSKCIEINTDKISLKIPSSKTINDYSALAPIISLKNDNDWLGDNKLISKNRKIKSIETKELENGELFVKYKVTYDFENKGQYVSEITLVKGYPFVIFEEDMKQIPVKDSVKLECSWTNFSPKYRWGNPFDGFVQRGSESKFEIDKPFYPGYSQEDPHWSGMGWIEDPSKEMFFHLLPMAGNMMKGQSAHISFWEEGMDNSELGVFVYDFNKWKDSDYGVWQNSQLLAVDFRYTDDVLYWEYPINSGSRSTALMLSKNKESQLLVDNLKTNIKESGTIKESGAFKNDVFLVRAPQVLKQIYSTLNLNKVKQWVLNYDLSSKRPANPFVDNVHYKFKNKEEYYKGILKSLLFQYSVGVNTYAGVNSMEHRVVFDYYVEGYLRYYDELSEQQRKTVEAALLLSGYINSQEDMVAIRSAIFGAPNVAADGWSVPAQIAYVFPEHAMSKEWLDYYQKQIEINGLFYTRPPVKKYESKGGRWTESLAVYNWAYMRPTSHSNLIGVRHDGKNRWADEHWAARGKWFLGQLTAPVYNPYIDAGQRIRALRKNPSLKINIDSLKANKSLTPDNDFVRYYPSHGAHGTGTTIPTHTYGAMLADWLKYYDPITSEYLFWSNQKRISFEKRRYKTSWDELYKEMYPEKNQGTNPHLRSLKFTGHGIVLRNGVDQKDEMSVHLDQVDKGPNYRYGHQARGGTGALYFYAGGRMYTGHDHESNGDHIQNNTDNVTNFGAMKNGSFNTIGRNELTAPLYDLDFVQFGELLSVKDKSRNSYSWPEYLSRSAFLVGTDYFILYDKMGVKWRPANRFSWSIGKENLFPQIYFLDRGESPRVETSITEGSSSFGFYRDSQGSCATLVAPVDKKIQIHDVRMKKLEHLEEEKIFNTYKNKDSKLPYGIYQVDTKNTTDIVFCDDEPTVYKNDTIGINGRTGVIRYYKNDKQEVAIINGDLISTSRVSFSFSSAKLGWSAKIDKNEMSGKAKTLEPLLLTLRAENHNNKFYINGELVNTKIIENGIEVKLPKGEFHWEYTATGGTPNPPIITRTEYMNDGVNVFVKSNSVVKEMQLEFSKDFGRTWVKSSKTTSGEFFIKKIDEVNKIHVRVKSILGDKQSISSSEYPIYFESEKPHYPEGLSLKLSKGQVDLKWGQVLGAQSYNLYKRKKGERKFNLIYQGLSQSYVDKACNGVVDAYENPGSLDNLDKPDAEIIYEYCISTKNGLGEGEKSHVIDTNPKSWLNWYPNTSLKFKRRSAFWMPPYVYEDMVPPKYYPE